MIDSLSNINGLSILAALVPSFLLGGVWFGVVVAKPYIIALGRQALPAQKPSALFILGPTICNLIAIVTSAVLVHTLNVRTVNGALAFGALIGIGYVLSTCMTIAINPNFPRPFLYMLINAPYFLASSVMSSVILVSMR